jgi:hypothetical protein
MITFGYIILVMMYGIFIKEYKQRDNIGEILVMTIFNTIIGIICLLFLLLIVFCILFIIFSISEGNEVTCGCPI